ncbi:MAG TPA: hypothetical protein PLI20_08245 [Bacillota bacterium]|nr:hypothetical protein [Bacillota bacterium]
MYRRIFAGILAAILILSASACVLEFDNAKSMASGVTKEYKETVEMNSTYQEEKPIKLNLDMKLAKAVIDSTDDKLAEVKFEYSSGALKPEFSVDDEGISIKNSFDKSGFRKPINNWEVNITDKLPLDVEINSDASDLRMNMGKMTVNKLNAQLNATSARFYFDEPNRGSVEKVRMDANASDIRIYNAGNIGFEILNLDSNASKVLIDMKDICRKDSEIRIDAKASTVNLKLPEDVGVLIIVDKYHLSSVRINNNNIFSQSEKEFISKDYDKAEKTLKIYADLNVTTINIE